MFVRGDIYEGPVAHLGLPQIPTDVSHRPTPPASSTQQWMTVRAQHHQRQRRRRPDENHEKLAFNFSSLLSTSHVWQQLSFLSLQPIRDILAGTVIFSLSSVGSRPMNDADSTGRYRHASESVTLMLLPFNVSFSLAALPFPSFFWQRISVFNIRLSFVSAISRRDTT